MMGGVGREEDWVDDDSLSAEETLARFAKLAPLMVAPHQRWAITHQPHLAYPVAREASRSVQRLRITRQVPSPA